MSTRRPRPPIPELLMITIPPDKIWSRAMSTGQAGAFLGKTDSALRSLIRTHAAGAREVEFDGVFAKQVGNRWLVKLHRKWVEGPR